MKRIGILTTYFSKNYGAALQAYALRKKLEDMGYDAEDIRYQTTYHRQAKKSKKDMTIFAYIKRRAKNAMIKVRNLFKSDANENLRDMLFDDFVRKYIRLSEQEYHNAEMFMRAAKQSIYDVYICGSDQIWNPIAHHFDPIYLLNFDTDARLVAYAPSIAYLGMAEAEKRRLADSLKKADVLSVREQSAADLLKEYVAKPISVVPDPTFLLDKNDWLSLDSCFSEDHDYVLVYLLQYNENPIYAAGLIEQYAAKHNCKIICLPYTDIKFKNAKDAEYRYDVAPNDFLHILAGCKMLFTNSFHATALAINLNKEFCVFTDKKKHSGIESRLVELLERFGLQDRMIEDSTVSIGEAIDYVSVNTKLAFYKSEGENFLRTAIEGLK